MMNSKHQGKKETPTCCLKVIFSVGVFLAKLDKKDRGKTKAALPTRTKPISIELTATDVPGLPKYQLWD